MKSIRPKHYWVLAALAVSALLASACAAPAATTAPTAAPATNAPTVASATRAPAPATATTAPGGGARGGTLTLAFYQEPNTLVTQYSNQTFAAWVGELVNQGLWNWDDRAQINLELAAEYPSKDNGGVSAGGLTLTYKLKKDLKWQDGQPLTSKDIKFTWQAIMNDKNTGIITRSGYDQIASIDTPDDQTAVVKFKQLYLPWYTLFTYGNNGGLLPEHLLGSKLTLDDDPFLRLPVGSGPFKVTEFKGGDHITLVASENFWRGRAKLDGINIKITPSRDAGNAALAAGDVDIVADEIEAAIPDLKALEPKATSLATPSQDYEHYFFNLGTKETSGVDGPVFFQDENVRKAFIMCIDRDTIAKKLLYGQTKVIATLWPNSQWDNTSLKPYPFDQAAAGKLLDAAGWALGDDGVRAKDFNGKIVRLSFAHSTTTGNQLRADVQVFATSTLRACGMEMLPRNYPSGPLFGTFAQSGALSTGNYDSGGYTTSFTPDPDPVDTFLCSGIPTKEHPNGNNWYRLCDKDLEKLSNDQAKEPDQAKRKALFDQMQKLLYDKAYVAPLYNRLKVAGVSAKVHGPKVSPIGDIYWSAYDWTVSK